MAKHGWFRRLVFTLFLIVLLAAIAIAFGAYQYLGPYSGHQGEKFVEVQHGMSSHDIARLLSKQGIVRSPWAFLAVR
ncbi:MAG: hypothetical protein JOZ45_10830, partial [Acidobacteriaceae bacterium]|nr:hypothetical protein [Acidobacteriaceae bacterium]